MTREIKFRGKRIDTGEWVYGYYYSECGNTYIIENRQKEDMAKRNIPFRVKADTIGQYTGLKDRDGKDVWEGDLLRTPEGDIMVAEWIDAKIITRCVRPYNPRYKNSLTFAYPVSVVVGNIYDNPELLEEGK